MAAKQSRLEKEAIEKRKELVAKRNYNRENEYSVNHKDAISDDTPYGKNPKDEEASDIYLVPNPNGSKTAMGYSMITSNGGGLYDREGRNGVGGRKYLSTISVYGPKNAYGEDSVDTSLNVENGQIIVS